MISSTIDARSALSVVFLLFVACSRGEEVDDGADTTSPAGAQVLVGSEQESEAMLSEGCQWEQGDKDAVAYEAGFLDRAVIERVAPEYPVEAIEEQIAGEVRVTIIVNKEGEVVYACADEGHELLREAAEQAALKWRFQKNFGAYSEVGPHSYRAATVSFEFVLPN